MAIASTTGAKIHISGTGSTPQANSTADTKSAYAALSYLEIKEVESIGEFGDQASTVTFTSLGDARVRKRKGVRDAGDLNVVTAFDARDNGQNALRAGEASDDSFGFKILVADSPDSNDTDSLFYFRALVSTARLSIGAANEIVKRNYAVLIDSRIVEDLSTAVSGG